MNPRRILLCLLAGMALAAASCEHGRLRKLAQAADGFALAVRAFQQAETAAHSQGLIADDEHAAIEQALLDVANAGVEFDNAIRLAQSKPSALAAFQAASASLDRLLEHGVLHIKNPRARQELAALLLSAKSFLATISSVLA